MIKLAAGVSVAPWDQQVIDKYYSHADDAHGLEHIQAVRNQIARLAQQNKYKNTVLADQAALLHDIGSGVDRKKHEVVGRDLVMSDPLITKQIRNKRNLQLLANAVLNHRASTGNPRSTLGKLLSDADRLPDEVTAGDRVRRAYGYGKLHEPELTDDMQWLRAGEHIAGKYGPGGYGVKGYFPQTNESILASTQPLMDVLAKKDIAGIKKLSSDKQAEIKLEINIGDTLLFGRYKNSPKVVKEIGTDDKGQPTINGMKLLACRIEKNMPKKDKK